MTLKGSQRVAFTLLAALASAGCQGVHSRRVAAAPEPPLAESGEAPATVVEAAPPRKVTFADRHPLFTKPRQYYDGAGDNKAAKIAAGTVVGIPAGIVGELKQIVVGQSPTATY